MKKAGRERKIPKLIMLNILSFIKGISKNNIIKELERWNIFVKETTVYHLLWEFERRDLVGSVYLLEDGGKNGMRRYYEYFLTEKGDKVQKRAQAINPKLNPLEVGSKERRFTPADFLSGKLPTIEPGM